MEDDSENAEMEMVDALEWFSTFRYASEVIAGKCTVSLLRACREWDAITLVEDVIFLLII